MATEVTKVTQLGWRRFMLSEAGVVGMLYLREKVPSIGKGEPHAMHFDAGFNQGYIKCLDTISEMLAADKPKEQRLDND